MYQTLHLAGGLAAETAALALGAVALVGLWRGRPEASDRSGRAETGRDVRTQLGEWSLWLIAAGLLMIVSVALQ